jgi:hypothetical protein
VERAGPGKRKRFDTGNLRTCELQGFEGGGGIKLSKKMNNQVN